ncbi:MAG TPA: oligosaccharide flippase family protein [Microvirga sp.]|jgi:O-antigen/teichoic acid export membrane protein|nr:oligosaccharide flippase family protein [Microvirga sp.]
MTLHRQAAGLTVMHAAEVVQPLLILPYAGYVLGPAAFGRYAYILALTQIASVIVDYGFTLTARRAAAPARHDPVVIRSLLAEIIAAKGILCLGVAVVALIAESFSSAIDMPTFICIMLSALGATLFPSWLFLGLERTWQAAIPVVAARVLALLGFFLLVRSPSDAGIAAAIQSAIPLACAIISLPYVLAIGMGGFRSLSLRRVFKQLQDGWGGFVSWLAQCVVSILPVPLVQHIGGFAAVGQYTIAERLISAARPVFGILQQTLMPRVAYLASHNPAQGLVLIWNSLWTLIIAVAMSLALYFIGPYVIIFLFGDEYTQAITLVRAMCVLPILMDLRICMADLYMFNYGYEKAWALLAVLSLVGFLVAVYVLSYWTDGAMAVAISSVIGEGIAAVASTVFFLVTIFLRGRAALRATGAADA